MYSALCHMGDTETETENLSAIIKWHGPAAFLGKGVRAVAFTSLERTYDHKEAILPFNAMSKLTFCYEGKHL